MTDARLSNRIQRIGASATMTITQKAREMKRAGRDVISLSAGEPDFDTPNHICEAAISAMAVGQTRYTNVDGIPELKSAIIRKFKRDNHLNVEESQINISPGGKAVIFNALAATLSASDEVIIPAPCWVSYPAMVKLCDAKPVIIPCTKATGFKLSAEALEKHITPQTKWVLLNSPSNPTGAAYSHDELDLLAQVLRQNPHVMVLSDDIYEHLIYDDFQFATLASIAPDIADRVLTMNGVSKAYAMTGWRIGYAAGPNWLIKSMSKYMGQTTSNPSSISQWAALAALDGSQGFLDNWRSTYQTRRNRLVDGLNSIKGMNCLIPPGAFYAFVDISALTNNDAEFALQLLEHSGVATVPGSAFHSEGHIRLSYATSMVQIEAALDRINKFVKAL